MTPEENHQPDAGNTADSNLEKLTPDELKARRDRAECGKLEAERDKAREETQRLQSTKWKVSAWCGPIAPVAAALAATLAASAAIYLPLKLGVFDVKREAARIELDKLNAQIHPMQTNLAELSNKLTETSAALKGKEQAIAQAEENLRKMTDKCAALQPILDLKEKELQDAHAVLAANRILFTQTIKAAEEGYGLVKQLRNEQRAAIQGATRDGKTDASIADLTVTIYHKSASGLIQRVSEPATIGDAMGRLPPDRAMKYFGDFMENAPRRQRE